MELNVFLAWGIFSNLVVKRFSVCPLKRSQSRVWQIQPVFRMKQCGLQAKSNKGNPCHQGKRYYGKSPTASSKPCFCYSSLHGLLIQTFQILKFVNILQLRSHNKLATN